MAYQVTSDLYPFAPSPKPRGLGQSCPSLSQLMGITDCTDPCQQSTAACNPGTIASTMVPSCYNTTTGASVICPTSGSVQTTSPGNTGPFGTAATTGTVNWAVLAAVLGGLVLLAAMSGK